MSNIIKFPRPKGKQDLHVFELNVEKIKKLMPKASTVKDVFAWLFLLVRLPLFLIMYWLRLPVIFLCNLVSIPMLIAWMFALYAFPDKTAMVWGFGIASFSAFVVSWAYDFILMAISPQDMMMTL
jgi:prepilin signal peptidase PulO-like enzyme (type II secretory pathway)